MKQIVKFISITLIICTVLCPYLTNAKTSTVKTVSYTANFEEYTDSDAMKTALAQNWDVIDPQKANIHQLITDPKNAGNKVLYMTGFSGLMWKEALNIYEFSADMKISETNDKTAQGTGSALLIRVNRENMAGKPVFESYPAEGRQLGTSGIVVYLWKDNINISVRTYDEGTKTIGEVANFGNLQLPGGKNARNDYFNVKVTDNGKGVIMIYIDNALIVTFTLSEEKEISDGTRTAMFYTKLKADFSSEINFWDNKKITEVNNAFVAASNGTISYATRSFGSYVGHYVDNISMNVYEEYNVDTEASAVQWVDFTDSANVISKYVDGKDMAAVAGGAKIKAEKGGFMYLRMPDEVVTDAANDYYFVIKYKYGSNSTTTKFFGNQLLTSAAVNENYASISSGGQRYLKALGQTVSHTNIILDDDGYYYTLVRVSYNNDKLSSTLENAKVKYLRIEFNEEADKIDELTLVGVAIYKDTYGFADNYNMTSVIPHAIPTGVTGNITNPPTGDAGFAVAVLMIIAAMILLKKERKRI